MNARTKAMEELIQLESQGTPITKQLATNIFKKHGINFNETCKNTIGKPTGSFAGDYKKLKQGYESASDLVYAYIGEEPRFNMFVINDDYIKATPWNEGEEIYTYSDPEMRQTMNNHVRGYLNQHKNDKIIELDGKKFKVDSKGNKIAHLSKSKNGTFWVYKVNRDPYEYMGDFSIITNEDGSNARWADAWDYFTNDSDIPVLSQIGNSIRMGDVVPEGNYMNTNIQYNAKDNDDKVNPYETLNKLIDLEMSGGSKDAAHKVVDASVAASSVDGIPGVSKAATFLYSLFKSL